MRALNKLNSGIPKPQLTFSPKKFAQFDRASTKLTQTTNFEKVMQKAQILIDKMNSFIEDEKTLTLDLNNSM